VSALPPPIGLAAFRDVIRAFRAAFDLERVDADLHQARHVFGGAQVLGVENVGAVFVLLDGHELTGTLAFLDEERGLVGIGVFMEFVFPAAGIRAGALVRIAAGEVA
jgi:hypothetical protein